ncbi:hypothetical protein K439DRAFT_1331941 [Ramaria rubella]|nr:hypothetical protein K439DRAFT_1331941 [Ramaria rubella]
MKIILTGPKNFQLWMLCILGALVKEKVLGVVTGVNLPPSTTSSTLSTSTTTQLTTSQSTGDDWQTRDYKAQGIIMDWVDNQLVNIGVNTFYNFVELTNLHWDGIMSIKDHISRFSTINSTLTSLKKPVDNFFLAMFLLQLLPTSTSWETFKSSVLHSLPSGTDLLLHS